MKLTLLGTGVPEPSLKRMSSGYLLQVDRSNILFDVGPGSYHRLLQTGLQPTDITHVFISHLHYDHCIDLIRLFLNRWDLAAGQVPDLQICGPPGLQQFVDRLFGEDGAFAPDLRARCNHPTSLSMYRKRGGTGDRAWPRTHVTELSEGETMKCHGWRVEVAEVPHVQPYLTCYGYRLTAFGAIFCYSGDSGPCRAMYRLADRADVLLHMCVWMENPTADSAAMGHRQLAELARDTGAKTLITTHFPLETDLDGARERAIADIGAIYSGRLIWGEDLMSVTIAQGIKRPRKSLTPALLRVQ